MKPSAELKVIGIDLTPILPGGENGGAKIFTIELIRQLGKIAPRTKFILLTSERSHDELAMLDAVNVIRKKVVVGSQPFTFAHSLLQKFLGLLPRRIQVLIARTIMRLYFKIKKLRTLNVTKDTDFDLLFCPFTAPTFYDPRVPLVATIYDLQYKTFPEFFTAQDLAHRDQTFYDACQKASRLAAISEYSRLSAIKYGDLQQERIRTIYLQMAQRVSHAENASLEAMGLQKGRFILYPANFWKHKNHEIMIVAFVMSCSRGLDPDIKLVLTGAPGERCQQLIQATLGLGIGHRVVFAGFISDGKFSDLLTSSLALVFPSLYEGFGLPIIEAMAVGIPVACSNVTSLPEIASGAALLFNPRVPEEICQAILKVTHQAELREKLISAGYHEAKKYMNSEKMAREYWDLFTEAFQTPNKRKGIFGVYADNWCTENLTLLVQKEDFAQKAEFEMSCPEWSATSSVEIFHVMNQKKRKLVATISCGERVKWQVVVPPQSHELIFEIGPFFIPAHCGMGDDMRKLTAKFEACYIVSEDGTRQQIFPDNVQRLTA